MNGVLYLACMQCLQCILVKELIQQNNSQIFDNLKLIFWNYFNITKKNYNLADMSAAIRKMYGLLTKCDVKMAGYWPSSYLRVYGPRQSRGPNINSQKKNEANIQPS